MNCDGIHNNLIDRLDDLLPPPLRGQFDSHIAACPRCADACRAESALRERLYDLAAELRGPSQRDAILARAARPAADAAVAPRALQNRTLRWLGWAAAAVFIALAVGLLPWPWSGRESASAAWAAVARRVQETQSVRIQMHFRGPDGAVAARGEIISTPERARIQEADGRIGVGEFASGQGIAIDPASRIVIQWEGRLEIPNLYQMFRDLRPGDGVEPRIEPLDGRPTRVFTAHVFRVDATVWADVETLLPVRLEYPMQMPLNGALVSGTAVATAFEWDGPIDESLFSLEPPAGYELRSQPAFSQTPDPQTSPAPQTPDGAATSFAGTVETRMHNLVYGALLCGSQTDQQWPTDISQIAPHIHAGTLHNPDRPEYEIGFVYIRPSGPVLWATPDNRRLMFYERFEAWPGSVRASFTDGSVERIDDQSEFERLVAEARENGGE
jgi:hypothetical protein